MAIGKVGSFATVQPAIVDFGGMAKTAIDSVKEDRERKRKEQAEKQKRELDAFKMQPDMETLDYSGIPVFDENLQNQMYNYSQEYAELSKLNTRESIMRQKEINSYINNLSSYNKSLKEGVVKILNNPDDYNEAYLSEAKRLFNEIDNGMFLVEESKGGIPKLRFFKKNEETGEVMLDENGKPVLEEDTRSPQSLLNIPTKFDITSARNNFSKTIEPDITRVINESKGKTTEETLFNDKRLKTAIQGTASQLSSNPNSLAAWWISQNPDKPIKTNFTLDDKKEAFNWYSNQLMSTISEKYKEDPFGRGRGGAAADVIQPSTTQLISPISLQQQGAPKIEGFRMNFTQGSKLNTKAGEATILGVFYDEKNDKLYSIRSEGASASTGVSGKDARGGTSVGAAKTPYLSEDLNEGQTDISSLITGLKLNNRDELINVIRQNYNQPQAQQTKDETPEQRANRLKKELGLK
jgi:hypothetical protein